MQTRADVAEAATTLWRTQDHLLCAHQMATVVHNLMLRAAKACGRTNAPSTNNTEAIGFLSTPSSMYYTTMDR